MNTWRDIKEAPLNQAVFATDGDMVFFGRFAMTADRKCMFEGQDIEEACNYGIEPACLTGWQPIPGTWKPEKSADEMFREMEYKRVPGCTGVYEKGEESPSGRLARICVGKNSVYKDLVFPAGSVYREPFTADEILACAQLIREMEADNG